MLNTIMALWNQDHGENRQRVVKIVFAILFITGSSSLFLFTLNSSAWSPFAGAQGQRTVREEQPTASNSRGIAITGDTPVDNSGTASVTPTQKTSNSKVIAQPSCTHIPDVVAQPRTTTIPHNVATSSSKSNMGNRGIKWIHAYPKAVHVKKGKHHSGNRSERKVIVPPSQAKKTAPVVPPVLPKATSTARPTVAPAATAEVIATTTPSDGTPVSNVPAIVTTDVIPDMSTTSTAQFTSGLRQKRALQASISPLVRSDKKSSHKKNDHVHGNVECSRSTTHKDTREGTVLKVERHSGLLLKNLIKKP